MVGFSKRTAEDQARIVRRLNSIVTESLAAHEIGEEDRIVIPTGDGMCVALIGRHPSYDVHLQLALGVLKSLHAHNLGTPERARRFLVRIGINQNTDILVHDVNVRLNVAGAGVNDASRITGRADGNQIAGGVPMQVHAASWIKGQVIPSLHPVGQRGWEEPGVSSHPDPHSTCRF